MLFLGRVTRPTLDVLRVLVEADGPVWGLQVIQQSSRGSGTVYPVLERLEQQGWLQSEWEPESDRRGPRRRLYRLTTDGAASAASALHEADSASRPTPKLRGARA